MQDCKQRAKYAVWLNMKNSAGALLSAQSGAALHHMWFFSRRSQTDAKERPWNSKATQRADENGGRVSNRGIRGKDKQHHSCACLPACLPSPTSQRPPAGKKSLRRKTRSRGTASPSLRARSGLSAGFCLQLVGAADFINRRHVAPSNIETPPRSSVASSN